MSEEIQVDELEPSKDGTYDPSKNPLRKPTWRWDRITYSIGRAKGNTSFDDQFIVIGQKYLKHYINLTRAVVHDGAAIDVDSAFSAAYVQWPYLSMAHKIYVNSNFARWAIEALVLANQTPEDIAKDLGCSATVVSEYETYFYDVRSRMQSELFIMDALLSPALKVGMAGTDYDFFWKGLAYWYGAPVLKAVWSMGTIPDDAKNQLRDCLQSMMERNTLRASVARQPNQYNAHDIIDEHLTLKQIEANIKHPESEIERSVLAGGALLVKAITFSVASSLGRIIDTGIELRAEQTLQNAVQHVLQPVDPLVRKELSAHSAFDRPVGAVIKEKDVDLPVKAQGLKNQTKNILAKIRAGK